MRRLVQVFSLLSVRRLCFKIGSQIGITVRVFSRFFRSSLLKIASEPGQEGARSFYRDQFGGRGYHATEAKGGVSPIYVGFKGQLDGGAVVVRVRRASTVQASR